MPMVEVSNGGTTLPSAPSETNAVDMYGHNVIKNGLCFDIQGKTSLHSKLSGGSGLVIYCVCLLENGTCSQVNTPYTSGGQRQSVSLPANALFGAIYYTGTLSGANNLYGWFE